MRWKKYSDEKPRKEHQRVLFRDGKGLIKTSLLWSYTPCLTDAFCEWLDHLEDGWIPVSERLPTEADGRKYGHSFLCVLVQTKGGKICTARWNHSGFSNGYFVAWQPLPAPYVPPEPPLWESDEARELSEESKKVAWDDYGIGIDDFQRELRIRGYAIQKIVSK